MNKQELFEFIIKNPLFFLATADNNIPHVRIMRVCFADERGIIFNTKKNKESYQQLINNPLVEMCFYDNHREIQIRISGDAEIQEDMAIKKEIVDKFTILQSLVEIEGYDIIVPVVLKKGIAKIWTRTRNSYEVQIG